MATVTGWSKFQRRQLHQLLDIQRSVGVGTVERLEIYIAALKSEMETDDIKRVVDALNNTK